MHNNHDEKIKSYWSFRQRGRHISPQSSDQIVLGQNSVHWGGARCAWEVPYLNSINRIGKEHCTWGQVRIEVIVHVYKQEFILD